MSYKHVFFDLDGTLSDPSDGEIESVKYALEHFGIHETSQDILRFFVGPPLKESFKQFYNMCDNDIHIAIQKYREYFLTTGIYKNKIYPGIENLLRLLRSQGKKTYVVTSNPTEFAINMLKIIGLYDYFTGVYGSNMDGTRVVKAEILDYCFKCNLSINKSESVMVGDRKYDVLGAHAVEIDAISVLYGFGSYEEIVDCSPRYIVNTVEELQKILI